MAVSTLVQYLVVVFLFALPIGGISFLGGRRLSRVLRDRRSIPRTARRRCRYCKLGAAVMTEQKACIELDDLVTTRCWVCSSCGLPHWTVTRSSVLSPIVHDGQGD